MRSLSKIDEAKKKISFAEYLITREDASDFAKGATKHVIDAARLAIQELTQFDNDEIESKSLVMASFEKMENSQYKNFYKTYFKLRDSEYTSSDSASNALKTVKAFVNWVEENRQN